jgi:chemotaxis protein methyltransferase CheR
MADLSSCWAQVTALMHRQTGVVLSPEQAYLLESRVQPVAQLHKFATIEQFVEAACRKPSTDILNMALVDAMTTHESYFFRDASFWAYLQDDILKRYKSNGKRTLRVWSAACSYGQEAYSLAMLLQESAPELFENTRIFASDISRAAIERGREGLYSSIEVNRGLSAPRLVKHFDKAPGGFKVKEALKKRIVWEKESILESRQTANQFDMVLCRNVLIYFDPQSRKIALKNLLDSTVETGYIGLGTSENLLKPQVALGWYHHIVGAKLDE